MIAKTTSFSANGGHRSERWRRIVKFFVCVAIFFCVYIVGGVSVNAAPRDCTHAEEYKYEQRTGAAAPQSHMVSCESCQEGWPEEHIYSNDQDKTCNMCGYVRTLSCEHKTFTYSNSILNGKLNKITCKACGTVWNSADSCATTHGSDLIYVKHTGNLIASQHLVRCDTCHTVWPENHVYDDTMDQICNSCNRDKRIVQTCTHQSKYLNIGTEQISCNNCGKIWNKTTSKCTHTNNMYTPHTWLGIDWGKHHVICNTCSTFWQEAHVYDQGYDRTCNKCKYVKPMQGGMPDVNLDVDNQPDFAWNVYKLMCSIAMPLAIISFASCGYRFLGSIFLGTYTAPSGGDMQKAQKQFIYTLLFIVLIILLPYIFREASDFFKRSAWTP